jgi:hypothetical protein
MHHIIKHIYRPKCSLKKNSERRVTPLCFFQLLDYSRKIKGNHLNIFKTPFFHYLYKKKLHTHLHNTYEHVFNSQTYPNPP